MAKHGVQAETQRRSFLCAAGSTLGLALVGCASGAAARREEHESSDVEISPGEDLMQEHGVLERVLLVYEEAARRLVDGEKLDLGTVAEAAGIIQRFIEGYHEKNEEQFVFPRLQAAGRQTDLVAVLLGQHQRGREVTAAILRAAGGAGGGDLPTLLHGFGRRYRPHAAREDTVVFPAFRDLVGPTLYRQLGDQFEEREHELLGEHGFEDTVAKVARLEATLGIGDLAAFTVP